MGRRGLRPSPASRIEPNFLLAARVVMALSELPSSEPVRVAMFPGGFFLSPFAWRSPCLRFRR